MTTKDLVYLTLIGLTALVFYWNGFYAGVQRTLKKLEALDNDFILPQANWPFPQIPSLPIVVLKSGHVRSDLRPATGSLPITDSNVGSVQQ